MKNSHKLSQSSSKFLILLTGLFYLILVSTCEQPQNPQPDLSAIPHAAALPSTELSDEDKTKLLEATGKTISTINTVDLQNMLLASSYQLYIYAFWKRDCKECLSNIANLQALNASMGQEKMQVITINVGDNAEEVNLAVRSENIAFETYQLKILDKKWHKLLDESWDGSIPALFMVNKSEDVFLKYYKSFDTNELEAIIQTLII